MKKKLLNELKNLTDFRKDTHKIEYPLHEVIFMILFGLLKGYVTYKDLHCWMQYQSENDLFKNLFLSKSSLNSFFVTKFLNFQNFYKKYHFSLILQKPIRREN